VCGAGGHAVMPALLLLLLLLLLSVLCG